MQCCQHAEWACCCCSQHIQSDQHHISCDTRRGQKRQHAKSHRPWTAIELCPTLSSTSISPCICLFSSARQHAHTWHAAHSSGCNRTAPATSLAHPFLPPSKSCRSDAGSPLSWDTHAAAKTIPKTACKATVAGLLCPEDILQLQVEIPSTPSATGRALKQPLTQQSLLLMLHHRSIAWPAQSVRLLAPCQLCPRSP